MAETLWDAITDFFAPETGRRRRAALDRAVGDAVMGLLGPTGVAERVSPIVEAVNPVASMERAGQASQRVFDPSLDRAQRIAATGDMLSEMAGTAAPGMLAARYGAPAAQAIEETLLGFSQPVRDVGADIVDRLNQPGPMPTLYSNPIMRASDELPAPRNEAEAMARDILELRAVGRAGDVTEEMMALADPQYMYANTPLPMDEASRMARAAEMGLSLNETYHGTPYADIQALRPSDFGAVGPGVYVSRNQDTANDYARGYGLMNPVTFEQDFVRYTEGGNVMPLMVADKLQPFADWSSARMRDMQRQGLYGIGSRADEAATREAIESGFEGVAARNENSVIFDPANVRSRFARFDPEFRHLRNLSAGFGGLGLLGSDEDLQRELEAYLEGR